MSRDGKRLDLSQVKGAYYTYPLVIAVVCVRGILPSLVGFECSVEEVKENVREIVRMIKERKQLQLVHDLGHSQSARPKSQKPRGDIITPSPFS